MTQLIVLVGVRTSIAVDVQTDLQHLALLTVEMFQQIHNDGEALAVDGFDVDLVRIVGVRGRIDGYGVLWVALGDVAERREIHIYTLALYHLAVWYVWAVDWGL